MKKYIVFKIRYQNENKTTPQFVIYNYFLSKEAKTAVQEVEIDIRTLNKPVLAPAKKRFPNDAKIEKISINRNG